MEEAINYTVEALVCNESFLHYYYGTNESDRLDWEDWQKDNPERKLLAAEASQLLDQLSLKRSNAHIQMQWANLRPQLRQAHVDLVPEKKLPKYRIAFRRIAWAAAAVFVLLIGAIWFWKAQSHSAPPLAQVVENPKPATVSMYRLPDGTLVRLKTGSSLRLSDAFGQSERLVYLEGEGYFEVAEDKNKPFKVQAGNTLTTALGTVFNVRAYPNDAKVKVVLVSGKIKVERQNQQRDQVQSAILTPGQQIVVREELLEPPSQADIAADTRWKDGYVITFRATPFKEVAVILSENYRVTIEGYENTALENHEITAEFDRSTPIDKIMEALAFSNNFKFEIKEQAVLIAPNEQ